jgi:hypothetical protein
MLQCFRELFLLKQIGAFGRWPNRRSSKPRPTTDRHGYPPLKFVPTHEAEAAYAAFFP